MENICIIISGFLLLFMIKNSHKAILLFAVCSILFQDYLCLRYSSPNISLYFVINCIAIGYIYIKKRLTFDSFPLLKSFYFLFFTYIIGVFVSPLSFSQTVPYAIGKILSYLFVIVFYNEIISYNDIRYSYYSTIVVILLLCIYSIVEFILQFNPLLTYISTLYPDEVIGKIYQHDEVRFFSKRCQSLLSISISWGAVCSLWISFIVLVKNVINNKLFTFLIFSLIMILSFNVFISGSRSSYILFLFSISILFLTLTSKYKIFFILLFVLFFISFIDLLSDIFTSFTDKGDINGSSSSERTLQLNGVLNVISDSPLWGLGIKGFNEAKMLDSDILGAESIWLQRMISFGLIGVISQLYLYISLIQFAWRSVTVESRFKLFLFIIGWVIFSSITSSPGLSETYFIILLIVIINNEKYKYQI